MKPTYEELEAEVLELRRLLKIALDRVSVLEERLNKNSKNSSKSPSSDQKSNTSAEEKKSKKSRTGVARVLYPPERVDKEVLCTKTCCAYCQSRNLQSIPGEYFVWQQAELPEMQAEITQFSCEKYRCRDCHTRSTADLPKGVPFSAFGPKLMALTAMLTGRFHLAKREAIEFIKDLYDVDIAEGSVINIEGNIATAIADIHERIQQFVIGNGIARYCDETSWRNNGKTHYVWLGTTSKAAFYKLDRHRSQEAFLRIIGSLTAIPTITDRYNAYNVLTGPHQYCLAHLIRDFKKFAEHKIRNTRPLRGGIVYFLIREGFLIPSLKRI